MNNLETLRAATQDIMNRLNETWTVKYGSRSYTIQRGGGRDSFVMTGKRGASYILIPNKNNPSVLFCVNQRGYSTPFKWAHFNGSEWELGVTVW